MKGTVCPFNGLNFHYDRKRKDHYSQSYEVEVQKYKQKKGLYNFLFQRKTGKLM